MRGFLTIITFTKSSISVQWDLPTISLKKSIEKLRRKKTRYTNGEIQIAYETLIDDEKRRQYDNYIDYQNEESCMFGGYVLLKFFNWIWKARRWFSFCRSEPPAFDCKTTCQRYFCFLITAICMLMYFVFSRATGKDDNGFRSLSGVLLIYSLSFAGYFGMRRILNDNFNPKSWFWMSVFGGNFRYSCRLSILLHCKVYEIQQAPRGSTKPQ